MPQTLEAPVGIETTALATIAKEKGITPVLADQLVETFVPLAQQAADIIAKSSKIVVTDPTQLTEIKASHNAQMELRKIRTAVEASRKDLKDESLKRGQAIDAVAKYLKERIEPEEERLENQKRIAERMEAERKANLAALRGCELEKYGVDPELYPLGEMNVEAYAKLLEGSMLAHQAQIERDRKAEADRVAAEQAAAEERERHRIENERLKAEADKREAEHRAEMNRIAAERRVADDRARKDREAAEAAARKDREAREKVERELAAKKKAEAEAEAARVKAEKKAARAPDRQKVLEFVTKLCSVNFPEVKSPEADALRKAALMKLQNLCQWITEQAAEL